MFPLIVACRAPCSRARINHCHCLRHLFVGVRHFRQRQNGEEQKGTMVMVTITGGNGYHYSRFHSLHSSLPQNVMVTITGQL